MADPYLTPLDVAGLLNVSKVDSVYALISSGAISAVNVAAGSGRPRWRISQAALTAFLEARKSTPAVPQAKPRKVRRPKVTTYF